MAAFEAWLVFLILVVNVVGELQRKRTFAASRGLLAAARLSCFILVSIERALFLLVINSNFGHLKLQNKLFSQPRPLFEARGNPLEFRYETYPGQTRVMGLPCGENFIL